MSLVVLEDLGLEFGGRSLFAGLGARIGEEDRIGLVGRNGSGKSSLIKIIAGRVDPNTGRVRRARGVRIGFLPQEIEPTSGKAVRDTVVESVPGRVDLEDMLAVVEEEIAVATEEREQMALAQKLADLHEDLAHFETTYSAHEAVRILSGLGFRQEDMERDVGELSGGWRMRVVLASLLFQKPDLLLLDEPTNHLDVPSVAWLGSFLERWRGAFVLICHDRTFLNEQVRRIVAFEPEGVRQYDGNYEAYVKARGEELAVLERRAANLAREREAAERFIRRFRAQASKARAVQSRIKRLERMDEVELPGTQATLSFRFPPCQRTGADVFALHDVSHAYGDNRVFASVEVIARRGDRIAIVGANGNGKTTLLKLLAARLQPTAGTIRVGHNVTIGYYAQHVTEQLHLGSTIFEEVWRETAQAELTHVRNALGTMLFSGDDVEKAIGVLSGGEKARVALAKLLVNPGNVILMDEPTNHLDLESSEALASALETFDGTLLFVSHNRSFVGHLATKVWNVEDGRVLEFPGTFDEYMDRCRRLERERTEGAEATAASEGVKTSEPTRQQARPSDSRKALRKRIQQERKLERNIAELERRIVALEEAQAERSSELSLPATYADQKRYNELLDSYRSDAAKLEELMARWESAQAELTQTRE